MCGGKTAQPARLVRHEAMNKLESATAYGRETTTAFLCTPFIPYMGTPLLLKVCCCVVELRKEIPSIFYFFSLCFSPSKDALACACAA